MNELDRLKKALVCFIERALQRVDYYALYTAKVVKQNTNGTLELQPEDARFQALLPGLTSVPIRYGIPGVKVEIPAGGRVAVGFEGGNPQFPVVVFWDNSLVTKLVMEADKIYLGGDTLTEPAAKGQTLETYLTGLKTAFDAHTHVVIGAVPAVPPTAPVTTVPIPLFPVVPDIKAAKVEVK